MRLRRQPRAKAITETDLVTMSDIAFLLIIFFMITTQFMRDNAEVELPELGEHDRTESSLSVALDAQGRIHLDGDVVETPAGLEAELRQRLSGREAATEREVRFRCQADLTQTDYGPVMEAISAAGGVIAIIIEREQDATGAP
jgi:biopolymer transport protein ExbD